MEAILGGFPRIPSDTINVECRWVKICLGGGFRLRRRFLQVYMDTAELITSVLMGRPRLRSVTGMANFPDANTLAPRPDQETLPPLHDTSERNSGHPAPGHSARLGVCAPFPIIMLASWTSRSRLSKANTRLSSHFYQSPLPLPLPLPRPYCRCGIYLQLDRSYTCKYDLSLPSAIGDPLPIHAANAEADCGVLQPLATLGSANKSGSISRTST